MTCVQNVKSVGESRKTVVVITFNIWAKVRYFDMDMWLNYNVDRCKMQVLFK